MKSTKGTTINRVFGSLKRRTTSTSPIHATYPDESPEAITIRNVTLFCESGNPGQPGGSDEEVLYLPVIVEACESSPSAAKEAAYLIRKYLSRENYHRPHVQYNSVMLIRILAENPGPTFNRNLDAKFIQSVKDLLRFGQDPNIRILLVETLNKFSRDKAYYDGIGPLVEMWGREQERMRRQGVLEIHRVARTPINNVPQQGYPSQSHSIHSLPSAQELSMRIVEARTSANLLSEVTGSTAVSQISSNELIQELVNRCQNANLSIQMFISAQNPAPDNDVMESLIETNEIVNNALSKHQRALLKARKTKEAKITTGATSERGIPSQPGSGGDSLKTIPRKEIHKPSTEQLNDLSRLKIENPFSDSKSSLHSNNLSAAGPEGKYMMHAGGSDSISTEKKKDLPNTPVYRY